MAYSHIPNIPFKTTLCFNCSFFPPYAVVTISSDPYAISSDQCKNGSWKH